MPSERLTDEQLAEWQQLADRIRKEEWRPLHREVVHTYAVGRTRLVAKCGHETIVHDIVAAREAVLALLDELERLHEEKEQTEVVALDVEQVVAEMDSDSAAECIRLESEVERLREREMSLSCAECGTKLCACCARVMGDSVFCKECWDKTEFVFDEGKDDA